MNSLSSDHLVHLISHAYPGLMTYIDRDFKYLFISKHYGDWFNIDIDKMIGKNVEEVLGPEAFLHRLPYMKKALDGEVVDFDSTLTHKELGLRNIKQHYYPDRNEKGEISGFIAIIYDYTEQKRAEKAARENEARFYHLLMQAPMPISLIEGPDFVFELINQPARSYYGGRDLTGFKLKDAIPEYEEQGFIRILQDIYEKGESVFFPAHTMKIYQPDGSFKEFYFDLYYEPLKDEDGKTTAILNIGVDVTDKVFSVQKLESAVKARDEFLSIASHELKTPLTSLKLQSQHHLRVLNKGRELPRERQQAMAIQTTELVSRLSRLIDDMLDVSRIKTGKMKLEKSLVDLEHVVREIIHRMGVQFEEAGVSLPQLKVQDKIIGHWDRFRIEQVIGNLLTNAIRYGKGKPISIQLKKSGTLAILSVSDLGYGIAKQDQERIFSRFERAIDSSEVSGMGLGLFISREIVEAHGGRITVDSEIGRGSTFTVELPLGEVP